MSQTSSQSSSGQDDTSDLVRAARPITAPEAVLIEEEARKRAGETGQEVMGERRRGRVEAEAHRVSEEMTRRAQEQHRAAEHPQTPPPQVEADDASRQRFPPTAAIKRVLVLLSGAAFAERAIPYAVSMARLTGAVLALTHVGDPPLAKPVAALERTLAALSRGAKPAVFPVAESQSPAYDNLGGGAAPHLAGIEWLNLPDGPVTQSLLEIQASDGSDLGVLATSRHPGAEGDTLGTVARALIRHGRAPVLVISPGVALPEEGLPAFRRILVTLDGSVLAEQALATLISVLCAWPNATPGSGAGEGLHEIVLFSAAEAQQTLDDTYRYLSDIREVLQSTVLANVCFSVETRLGSAPGAIVMTAEHGGEAMREHPTPFDLVVLATHGRGGLRRWLLGSVAEYVLTHATVPVLVVRPTMPAPVEDQA